MVEAFKLLGEISLKGGETVRHQLEQIGDRVEKSGKGFGGFGLAMKGAGLAVGAVGTGLSVMGGALLKTGIGYNSMLENSTVAWTTLMGSQEKAKKQVQDIANFAAKTQFNTENVDAMAKYFHNAGFEGKGLFDQLNKIADVSGAFNISADSAQELARQMSQVDQAGVAYTEDLNILSDRGVPILQAIAKETGTNVGEVKKMASQGKITADIYNKAFNSIADSVKGSSAKQAQTFTGMLSTLGDEAGQFAGTMTASLFEKVKGFLNTAVDALGKMNEGFKKSGLKGALEAILPKATADTIINSIKSIGDAFKWIKDNWKDIVAGLTAIGTAYVAFKVISTINKGLEAFKALMIAQETVTIGATVAQYAFNLAMSLNPIAMIAIGIGALIGIIILLWLNWDKVSAWLKSSWDATVKLGKKLFGELKDFFGKWGLTILAIITGPIGALVIYIVTHWSQIKSQTVSIFTSVWNWLTSTWNSIKSTVTSVASSIWSSISSTFHNIYNTIKDKVNDAKNAVSNAINAIKGFFSGLHLSLPNIKMPHFHMTGGFSLDPPKVPSISVTWAQKGGLVNRATLIGAGEAGNEAILPLQGKHMLPMAKAISDFLGQQTLNRQSPTEVPIMINGRELARAIIVDIDQEMERRAVIRRRGV